MLRAEDLNKLPANVHEFIAQKPDKLAEIANNLSEYSGRLREVVDQITPQEVLGFQDFIHRTIPPEQKQDEVERVIRQLEPGYKIDIKELDPRAIFDFTPARPLDNWELMRIPIEEVAQAYWQKNLILEAFNHPFRIKMRALYKQDIAKRRETKQSPYQRVPEIKMPPLTAQEIESGPLHSFSEFVVFVPGGEKMSRQLALAVGPYSVIGRDQIGISYGSETMHFLIGNPTALADILRCHGIASAPRNGKFSDAREQANLIIETLKVLQSTPLLEGRDDAEEIFLQWCENFGPLVEPNPYNACKRIDTIVKALYKAGYDPEKVMGQCRVYMVEGADEMIDTAQIIRHYFPFLKVSVGMAVNLDQIRQAEEIQVASIGLGIGSGSGCDTPGRTGAPTQNFNFLHKINKLGIGTPLFSETGIPHHAAPVALSAGIRRINYTAGILGYLSGNGEYFAFRDARGNIVGPYDPEAGQETKRYEGRVYPWEMEMMLEGNNGERSYDPAYPTIPHRLWYLTETEALTTTFHRTLFLEDLIYKPDLEFNLMSPSMMNQVRPFKHF